MEKFSKIDLGLPEFLPFVPFYTGHSQTLLGHLVPSKTEEDEFRSHILKLPDGDEIHLLYKDLNSEVTLSVYHGLGGDAGADYIRRTARVASQFGWNIILVNHRKASPLARAERTYHSGRGDDASAVINWAREQFPGTKQVAVGFSMSGSILLNLVCGRYGLYKPDFAVVVNAPLKLSNAATLLSRGFSKIYDLRFYLILKSILQKEGDEKLPTFGRTFDIDERFTSRINGFKNAEDYYEKCSSYNYLSNIDVPTFVLSSFDDPFIDVNDYLQAKWSSCVHLTLARHGGHMGYFSKNKDPRYGRRWLDLYLESVFKKIKDLL